MCVFFEKHTSYQSTPTSHPPVIILPVSKALSQGEWELKFSKPCFQVEPKSAWKASGSFTMERCGLGFWAHITSIRPLFSLNHCAVFYCRERITLTSFLLVGIWALLLFPYRMNFLVCTLCAPVRAWLRIKFVMLVLRFWDIWLQKRNKTCWFKKTCAPEVFLLWFL